MLERTQSSRDDINSKEKDKKKKSRMRKKLEQTQRKKQEATQGDSRTTQKESNELVPSNDLEQKSSQPVMKTVSAKGKSAEEEITQPSEKAPKELLVPLVSNMRSKERMNERPSHLVAKRQRPREPASYSIGSGRNGRRRKKAMDKSDIGTRSQDTSFNEKRTDRRKNSSEGVKWLGIDWSWLFMTGCLASAAFSPAQIDLLAEYTRFYGGFYFFAAFMLLLVAIQMPLTFLMIHCPQFTQSGLTTIAPTFGHLYRALGFGMFCYCVLNQGLLVHEASIRVDFAVSVTHHTDTVIGCKMRDMDYFSNFDAKQQCSSLANSLKCANGSIIHCDGMAVPLWTRIDISENRGTGKMKTIEPTQRPSAKLFMKSKSLKKAFNIGHWSNYVAFLSIFLLGAIACFGPTVLAVFTSVLGLCSLTLVFTLSIWLMVIGTPGEALLRLVTLSQPQRFFSVGVFSALFELIVAPIGLNFSLMSIASFRPRRSDSFTVACFVSMIHTAVFVLFFMANVSMCSAVENIGIKENRATSIPSVRLYGNKMHWNHEYWQNLLPEFFGLFGSPDLYILSMITEFSIYFISLISPFFAVMVIARDHEINRRRISYRLLLGLLSGTVLLLSALLRHFPNVAGQLRGPSLAGFFTVIFVVIVVRLYGKREFALDLSTMYPLTGTFRDYFGPFSPMIGWFLYTLLPFTLSVLLTCRLFLKFDFDREKEDGFTFSAFLEMFLPPLPIIIFFAIFLFDFGRWFHHLRNAGKRRSLWHLVYPSSFHPSYNRIMDGFGDEDEGVKLHSKETVVSRDHLSLSHPQSSHTQSGKNM